MPSKGLAPEVADADTGGLAIEARAVIRLATPIALAQFGLMALGLVDVAILGRSSAADLGGASIGRSLGFAATALSIGASSALEPLAAQALGARETASAWRSLLGTLGACAVLWVPTTALALGSTELLVPLGIAPELARAARAFLVGNAPGMLAFPVFLTAKTFLQAHYRTSPALVGALIANVVNVIACNLLVRGDEAIASVGIGLRGLPALGALGAGLASSLSTTLLAVIVLVAARRTHAAAIARDATDTPHTTDALALPTPSLVADVLRVLRIGVPIGFQMLAEIGVFSVVGVVAGRLGTVPVAAHQIALSLASFTFMGVLGVSGATAVRVGRAVGAGLPPRRAGLVGIALGAAFMVACGALFFGASRALTGLFTSDPQVLELGVSLLGVAAAFQLFDGVQGVAAGALRGAGDVRFAFVANVAAHWAIGFPVALVLAFPLGLGIRGLWWGLALGLGLVAAALTARFVVVTRAHIARR
jgi:MATE family multidrug resistance protein